MFKMFGGSKPYRFGEIGPDNCVVFALLEVVDVNVALEIGRHEFEDRLRAFFLRLDKSFNRLQIGICI